MFRLTYALLAILLGICMVGLTAQSIPPFLIKPTPPSSTCSAATVAAIQTCIDDANFLSGGVITLASGSLDFNSTITLGSKSATIQGNSTCTSDGDGVPSAVGACATVLLDKVAAGFCFNITLGANVVLRFKDFEMRDSTGNCTHYFESNGSNTDSRRLVIQHMKFNSNGSGSSAMVVWPYTTLGVLANSYIIGSVPAFLGYVKENSWDGGTNGHGSWAADDLFGTENFWFVENNTIVFDDPGSASTHTGCMDAQAGGRFVARYNRVTRCDFEGHGTESSTERSTRAVEIYHNTFLGTDGGGQTVYLRGGVGLVYDNASYGYQGSGNIVILDNRSSNSPQPFANADGTSIFDANDAGNPFDTCTATSAGTLTVSCSGKSWTVNQWAGYLVAHTSGISCASITRSGSTYTATCASHGLTTGDVVSIRGATTPVWNGWAGNPISGVTVTNGNVFTYSNNYTPTSPADGTPKAVKGAAFSRIASNTATQLTFIASIYGNQASPVFATNDTIAIRKVTHYLDQIGRKQGTLLTGEMPSWSSNDQTTSPWYEANNLRCPSSPPTINCASGANIGYSVTGASIVLNTHYINDTTKPGYTPYTYPHPLIN